MKYLEQGLKNLPINLKHLKLSLYENKLGKLTGNMKILG